METLDFKIPNSILKILKLTISSFYSDIHIVIIDFLLKLGYASEYSISKELGIPIEKIRMTLNNLNNDNFVEFEERFFKQINLKKEKNKKQIHQKFYKLKYWYINANSITFTIRQKIWKIFNTTNNENQIDEEIFLFCPRKMCGKKFSISDINSLSLNDNTGKFSCNNYINPDVVCGAQLYETRYSKKKPIPISANFRGKFKLNEFKPILNLLLSSAKNIKF
ncbi:TATA binding protein of transcription factor IIE (nucleomorph) [Chroomonas mesostigmatica CCMP1168]|uniref:TATA binding protein of transcription factor IIE n=1 Tax=Chroomonas mesostigmatica CCMP1168 TaxID=1195612 RepID=J7G868_9CRYP|nr:TATA binding protein of transcription factor IIE [Chroomonas mesostigmatica CCMP1168]|mmetsp:Transcript_25142/g.61801  ORF Transcript_25142/g.61801 Transcript_25142/m.61801 type:complete len:222 (-) Transcript_25142:215-880(-)